MQVRLTETQFARLVLEESMARLLQESVPNLKNLEMLKKTVKRLLAAGIATAAIITAIDQSNLPAKEKEALMDTVTVEQIPSKIDKEKEKADSLYKQKVEACKDYMEYALNNQNYSLSSTKLKPETLVKVSMETNFDLPFLMAVAHQESCFGATPRARKTGSVFSEGLYDNGHNAVRYSDPNESVYGFVNLLKNDYLVNGKQLPDLLKPGSFVNINGHRYASDANYENKIRYLRNKIAQEHPELLS